MHALVIPMITDHKIGQSINLFRVRARTQKFYLTTDFERDLQIGKIAQTILHSSREPANLLDLKMREF